MKKSFLLLMFCMLTASAFCQRTYEFDYILEYQHRHEIDNSSHTWFSLTNSQDNSYVVSLSQLPNEQFHIIFYSHNGVHGSATISKTDFFKAETLTMKCDNFHHHHNDSKKTVGYNFVDLPDTIIGGKHYKQYRYKPADPKQEKRKKLATETYIIEPGTDFHLPTFQYTPAYNKWKSGAKIPAGLIYKTYVTKPKSKKNSEKNTLLTYTKMKKFIIIPADCFEN